MRDGDAPNPKTPPPTGFQGIYGATRDLRPWCFSKIRAAANKNRTQNISRAIWRMECGPIDLFLARPEFPSCGERRNRRNSRADRPQSRATYEAEAAASCAFALLAAIRASNSARVIRSTFTPGGGDAMNLINAALRTSKGSAMIALRGS